MRTSDSEGPEAGAERQVAEGGLGRRVGFFGGSFDPPHLGHLAVARAAREGLKLDTVLFAPVGAQPLKPQGSTASFAERLEMTRLAIQGEAGFAVSLLDAPVEGARPNYTLETLRKLRTEMDADGALYCLMGADSFLSLRRWHGAAEIPFAGWLVVASRPGQKLDDLAAAMPEGLRLEEPKGAQIQVSVGPPSVKGVAAERGPAKPVRVQMYLVRNEAGETAPFYLLPGLDVQISASEIRSQVRSASLDHDGMEKLVPAAVARYIRERRLYGR